MNIMILNCFVYATCNRIMTKKMRGGTHTKVCKGHKAIERILV